MKTLPIDASQEEIRNLVVEWSELLAQERYQEACELIQYDDTQIIDGERWIWTPEKLEAAVVTYGEPWYTIEELKQEYGPDWTECHVTSIWDQPKPEEILASIDISSEFDWMGEEDVAVIHYDHIPIDGKPSDLTARFFLRKVGRGRLTLVFYDLHVL